MHYRNGREAKVGDQVVGVTYNRKGQQVAGTLVALIPGEDSCSAKVGFIVVHTKIEDAVNAPRPVAFQRTQHNGAGGEMALIEYVEDYTHAGNLWHADDAHWVNAAGDAVQPPIPA
jgi:hypothetical protein